MRRANLAKQNRPGGGKAARVHAWRTVHHASRVGARTLAALAGALAISWACAQSASVRTEADARDDTVEWLTLSGALSQTRYSPAKQIDAQNFARLETAWVWDGASFGARSGRATPSYMNGKLITVAGERRHVVAIDPETGETIWSYREPNTGRYEY